MKQAFYRHTSIHQFTGAIIAMLFILSISSFAFNQLSESLNISQKASLQDASPNDFFIYFEVEPTQSEYHVGATPSFFFTKEYYVTGKITGVNILKCEHFRSGEYVANGFIEKDQLNQLLTGNPFVFGGNIPDFPTQCVLRTIISFCEEKYGVCKTQTTISEPFEYIE